MRLPLMATLVAGVGGRWFGISAQATRLFWKTSLLSLPRYLRVLARYFRFSLLVLPQNCKFAANFRFQIATYVARPSYQYRVPGGTFFGRVFKRAQYYLALIVVLVFVGRMTVLVQAESLHELVLLTLPGNMISPRRLDESPTYYQVSFTKSQSRCFAIEVPYT